MNNKKLVINRYRSQQKFKDLKPGCCYLEVDGDDPAQIAGPFGTLDDGKSALAKFETSVQEVATAASTVYEVEEYALEEVMYDDFEEAWLSTGEVWAFSEWPDRIYKSGTYYQYDNAEGRLIPTDDKEDRA